MKEIESYLLIPFLQQFLALVLGDNFGVAVVSAGCSAAGQRQQAH